MRAQDTITGVAGITGIELASTVQEGGGIMQIIIAIFTIVKIIKNWKK